MIMHVQQMVILDITLYFVMENELCAIYQREVVILPP